MLHMASDLVWGSRSLTKGHNNLRKCMMSFFNVSPRDWEIVCLANLKNYIRLTFVVSVLIMIQIPGVSTKFDDASSFTVASREHRRRQIVSCRENTPTCFGVLMSDSTMFVKRKGGLRVASAIEARCGNTERNKRRPPS